MLKRNLSAQKNRLIEYPQHMFWFRIKKTIFLVRSLQLFKYYVLFDCIDSENNKNNSTKACLTFIIGKMKPSTRFRRTVSEGDIEMGWQLSCHLFHC